jgi:bifunctional enzyme CysN/CysC
LSWRDEAPLRVGDSLPLRLGTQENEARVVAIWRVLDATTLGPVAGNANVVPRDTMAEVRLRMRRPLVLDPAASVPTLGRFILLRENRIAGDGVVDSVVTDGGLSGAKPVASAARETLLGHRGAVIWLTGLSGSGKSTVANALEQRLLQLGILPVVLDGDVLRTGLCQGLGFSHEDRHENIRRAAEAALLMAEAGAVVISALISPFRADRQIAAERCAARAVTFAEVFVNAPLAECERRDPKHLYERARAGLISEFTGISSPYEVPQAPALELHTDRETVQESVAKLEALTLGLVLSVPMNEFDSGAAI